jgi:hypothetical protein
MDHFKKLRPPFAFGPIRAGLALSYGFAVSASGAPFSAAFLSGALPAGAGRAL